MIGSISGTVSQSGSDWLVIKTSGGVGYLVAVTSVLALQTPVGSPIDLFTHLVVREDQLSLYGFATESELKFFQQLIGISGLGPRMALSILAAGKIENIQSAIAQNDVAILTTISGIGRKTAERIMIELKNKVISGPTTSSDSDSEELLVALTQLGYNAYEIRKVAMEIPNSISTTEDRIKYALQLLSK